MEYSQNTFKGLKAAMTEKPVLALLNFTKTFKVQIDASDFSIEGVLMQYRHPIAFEIRKLNESERHYLVQEKEKTVIVYCYINCFGRGSYSRLIIWPPTTFRCRKSLH